MSHTCWQDECNNAVLVPNPEEASWKLLCPVCDDEYYACTRCTDGLDWNENDKGCICEKCGEHRCAGCGLEDGCSFAYREGVYTCSDCVKKLQESGVFGMCQTCDKELSDPSIDPIIGAKCEECSKESYKPKRRNRNKAH